MPSPLIRRMSPPDRRAPVEIIAGRCPAAGACFCCPRKHRRDVACPYTHPPVTKTCNPPYPKARSTCPERDEIAQDPPPAPPGLRPPGYACCVECGRITPRRWIDLEGRSLPWCAGLMPEPMEDRR